MNVPHNPDDPNEDLPTAIGGARDRPEDHSNQPPEGQLAWQASLRACDVGLRRFLSAKLPQPADVDDCMQAISLAVMTNERALNEPARKAWLFKVASNQAALWWRKQSTTDRVLEKHAGYERSSQDSSRNDPAKSLEQTELTESLWRAIETLPPDTATIIRLRIVDDLTFQKIADQLSLPLGTVLTRMRRAMTQLRTELTLQTKNKQQDKSSPNEPG